MLNSRSHYKYGPHAHWIWNGLHVYNRWIFETVTTKKTSSVKVGKLKKLCFLSSPFSSLLLIFPFLFPFSCDFRPFLYRTQKNLPFGPFPLKWLQIWRGSFSKIRLDVQLFILYLVRLNEIIVSYYSILYHYGYITQLGTIVIVPIPGC